MSQTFYTSERGENYLEIKVVESHRWEDYSEIKNNESNKRNSAYKFQNQKQQKTQGPKVHSIMPREIKGNARIMANQSAK